MAKKNLKYLSDIKLKQVYKRSKILTIIQTILVSFMFVFSILYTAEKGISAFTFLPLFFVPMVIMGIMQGKQLKKEIERRNG